MELYLQFGHGMMDHCKSLLSLWGHGTVILSPRDLTSNQIQRFSQEIWAKNGKTLLDPQLYNPRANHHRLVKHDYWPEDYTTGMFTDGPALANLLSLVKDLNDSALVDEYIIPGLYCARVDEDWFAVQENILSEACQVFTDKPKLATICISAEALRFEAQVENLLSRSENWDVDGYYVVAEHPNNLYLVDDPIWLANLLILSSGLKIQHKRVVVGYCNHQFLCLAAANVDAIAAGTWLNVRSFSAEKFHEADDDNTSRRVKWYYCPQSLSEYKLLFLDMGLRNGILNILRPDISLNSSFADVLFSGAQPTATDYSEQQSFRHYLQCVQSQCQQSWHSSFQETIDNQMLILDTAERLIKTLHRNGVRGQDRDFVDRIDVNRAALDALADSRGFVLKRIWC